MTVRPFNIIVQQIAGRGGCGRLKACIALSTAEFRVGRTPKGGTHIMPSFLAVVTASIVGFVFSRLDLPFIGSGVHAFLDLVVWILSFILMKRFITSIRP